MRKTIVLLALGIVLAAGAHIRSAIDESTNIESSFWMTSALASDQPAQDGTELAQSQEPSDDKADDKSSGADVDVTVTREVNEVRWYADPLWIGVGIGVALLVIFLIALAARSGGGSSTTVVRG